MAILDRKNCLYLYNITKDENNFTYSYLDHFIPNYDS